MNRDLPALREMQELLRQIEEETDAVLARMREKIREKIISHHQDRIEKLHKQIEDQREQIDGEPGEPIARWRMNLASGGWVPMIGGRLYKHIDGTLWVGFSGNIGSVPWRPEQDGIMRRRGHLWMPQSLGKPPKDLWPVRGK